MDCPWPHLSSPCTSDHSSNHVICGVGPTGQCEPLRRDTLLLSPVPSYAWALACAPGAHCYNCAALPSAADHTAAIRVDYNSWGRRLGRPPCCRGCGIWEIRDSLFWDCTKVWDQGGASGMGLGRCGTVWDGVPFKALAMTSGFVDTLLTHCARGNPCANQCHLHHQSYTGQHHVFVWIDG